MLEKTVEAHFIRQVKKRGGVVYKLKFESIRGAPDRLAVFPKLNTTLFVELKRPKGGRLSPHQKKAHEILWLGGNDVVVLSSIEEIDSTLLTITGE